MPYAGKFEGWRGIQVRIPPALHKEIAHKALDDDTNFVKILLAGLVAYTEGDLKVDQAHTDEVLAKWADA